MTDPVKRSVAWGAISSGRGRSDVSVHSAGTFDTQTPPADGVATPDIRASIAWASWALVATMPTHSPGFTMRSKPRRLLYSTPRNSMPWGPGPSGMVARDFTTSASEMSASRSADARAVDTFPGNIESTARGSRKNCAIPSTVTSSPTLMRPLSANHPAAVATPTARIALIPAAAPMNMPCPRAARRMATSASWLDVW